MNHAESFDYIAREIFFPLYAVIADRAVKACGKTAGKCLDVGCGGGMFGYHVAKSTDMEITFLDINPDAIEICRQRGREWGLSDRAKTLVSSVSEIDLPDDTFDLIVSRGSINFWGGEDDVRTVFGELHRVLKSGGVVMIGNSLGTPEIEAAIREKMKVHNPDWPDCVRRSSSGLDMDDHARIAASLGYDAEAVYEPSGSWVIIRK